MPNIITDEMGNPLISEQGAFIFDATKVNVGGVAQNEVNFTSDPQTQLDGKAPKDIVPTPSTADADKVIKVGASGNYELGEVASGGGGGYPSPLTYTQLWKGDSTDITIDFSNFENAKKIVVKTSCSGLGNSAIYQTSYLDYYTPYDENIEHPVTYKAIGTLGSDKKIWMQLGYVKLGISLVGLQFRINRKVYVEYTETTNELIMRGDSGRIPRLKEIGILS